MNTNQTGSEFQELRFYPWGQLWTNVGMMDWSYAGYEYRPNVAGLGLDPTLYRTYNSGRAAG